jgi:hypothetical protein
MVVGANHSQGSILVKATGPSAGRQETEYPGFGADLLTTPTRRRHALDITLGKEVLELAYSPRRGRPEPAKPVSLGLRTPSYRQLASSGVCQERSTASCQNMSCLFYRYEETRSPCETAMETPQKCGNVLTKLRQLTKSVTNHIIGISSK